MNQRGLTTGLFFSVSTEGVLNNEVWVTDASDGVFTMHYNESTSFENLKARLERDKYKVNKFEPPHLVRY